MDIKVVEGMVHTELEDKADAIASHIFHSPAKADVQDIPGTIYSEKVTTISKLIIQTEVEETIKNLPSDKAPSPDEMPSQLPKYCKITLCEVLTDLFNF